MTTGRAVRVLLGTLVATVLAVVPSVPAQAHTRAVASWPAVGEVMTEAPDRVTVLFAGDALADVRVSVVAPDGSSVVDGEPLLDGLLVSQALTAADVPGVYSASFEGVATDLHTITGSFEFRVDPDGVATGNPAGAPPDLGLADEATDDASDAASASASDVAREPAQGSDGPALLLTGLAGAVVLVVVIRLAGRRRRA